MFFLVHLNLRNKKTKKQKHLMVEQKQCKLRVGENWLSVRSSRCQSMIMNCVKFHKQEQKASCFNASNTENNIWTLCVRNNGHVSQVQD